MKTLLTMFLFISLFFPSLTKAQQIDNGVLITDWTINGKASTYVLHVENNEVVYGEWAVVIGNSNAGNTRIYIRVMANFKTCDNELLPNVFEIDGRKVSVQGSCMKYSGVEEYYVSFTPATNEGLRYVVETFKNTPSDELVYIDGFGDSLGGIKAFSADGFTEAYDLNRVL